MSTGDFEGRGGHLQARTVMQVRGVGLAHVEAVGARREDLRIGHRTPGPGEGQERGDECEGSAD